MHRKHEIVTHRTSVLLIAITLHMNQIIWWHFQRENSTVQWHLNWALELGISCLDERRCLVVDFLSPKLRNTKLFMISKINTSQHVHIMTVVQLQCTCVGFTKARPIDVQTSSLVYISHVLNSIANRKFPVSTQAPGCGETHYKVQVTQLHCGLH